MLEATACEVYVSVAVGVRLCRPLPPAAGVCESKLIEWTCVGAGCTAGVEVRV